MHRYSIVVCLLFVTLSASADAQDRAREAQMRLDYLVGVWDSISESLDADGRVVRTDRAVYVNEPFLGDKILLTTSVGSDGTVRKNLRFYDRADQRFYEIGLGREGDVWILSGTMDAYVMTTQARTNAKGEAVMYRFTHVNIQPNSFEAVMEVSRDRGATWVKSNNRQRLERRTGRVR